MGLLLNASKTLYTFLVYIFIIEINLPKNFKNQHRELFLSSQKKPWLNNAELLHLEKGEHCLE